MICSIFPLQDLMSYLLSLRYNSSNMLNKNVADYTNFDGKTNKKIVQAPGGASSFSLGWGNEPANTPPPPPKGRRVIETPNRDVETNDPFKYNYNQPMKVLEEERRPNPPQQQAYQGYSNNNPITGGGNGYGNSGGNSYKGQNNAYGSNNNYNAFGGGSNQNSYGSSQNSKYGGQYGYNNYVQNPMSSTPQQDTLDLTMEEHLKRRGTPQSVSSMTAQQVEMSKPSIRIHEQRSNMLIGDNSYNYWKDTPQPGRQENHPQHSRQQQFNPPAEKTSVKVHNPPGGKSSFTFG